MKKIIYVAWSNKQDSYSFISTIKTIEAIGCKPVVLDMVRSTDLMYQEDNKLKDAVDEHGILLSSLARETKTNRWKHSNVAEVAKDIDCIIFPGGSDICPTLWKNEGAWHGIEADTEYSAERDVSDYLLMSYCLEKNIKTLAICRGMQMLSVVSGADMINDIPTYFDSLGKDDGDTHRDAEKKVFAAHDVEITDTSSLLYKTMGTTTLSRVPSWHHQGVLSVENTDLVVTAETVTDGVQVIEGVERKDLTFCIGVQFHPEVAVRKIVDQEADAGNYMDLDSASKLFRALATN
ncbi:MAG: gamma-glutamyl-gamma-aminobutyrate hydrolase family protein [Bacilli bacterium]|nr:gamma-glutamyl-gamma-aminobutyrate hydrolase family protein [Bacilli bacterium]